MHEVNISFETENELVKTLATAAVKSLMVATLDGVAINKRERTAYTAGFLAATSIFTDTTTSLEILKRMNGRE